MHDNHEKIKNAQIWKLTISALFFQPHVGALRAELDLEVDTESVPLPLSFV